MIRRYDASTPMSRKQPIFAHVPLNSYAAVNYWNQMSLRNVIQHVSWNWSVNAAEQDIAVQGGFVRHPTLERDGQRGGNGESGTWPIHGAMFQWQLRNGAKGTRPIRGTMEEPNGEADHEGERARARPTGAGRRSTTPAGRWLGGSSSVRVIIGLVSGFSRVSCRETWRVPVPRIRDRLHRIEPRSPEGRPGGTIRGGWSASHVCGMATE